MVDTDDEHLHTLIDLIYDAGLSSDRWPAFLQGLAKTFDAKGVFYAYDTTRQTTPFAMTMGLDDAANASYMQHYYKINPYPLMTAPVDKVVYAHEVASPDVISATEFYSGFLRPQSFSLSHLAIRLVHDEQRSAILALSPGTKVFERAPEIVFRQLDRLRPHIRRAIDLNSRIVRAQLEALGPVLEAVSGAAFLLDSANRVLHLNTDAANLMRNERLLELDAFGGLRAARLPETSRLAAVLAAGGRRGRQEARLTALNTGRAFLAWTLAVPTARPDAGPNTGEGLLLGDPLARGARQLLIVVPEKVATIIPAELIQQHFTLTGAEARLAAALVSGRTVAQIAEQAGLSPKTLRNQLASVFSKTGTGRQAELVALVLQTVAPRSKHE